MTVKAGPEIVRLEARVLLAQPDETRDEQRRTCKQGHRKSDLCADEQLAEPLLAHATRRATAALLEGIDQIRARTLQRGIEPHHQSREQRKPDREEKNWQ